MKICGLTDNGLSRENNQDSMFVSEFKDLPLFIVADGMGGHNAGDMASSIAVETIKSRFYENKDHLLDKDDIVKTIKESVCEANKKVYFRSLATPQCSGMGTTLTMAYIFSEYIFIGHIGDSRAYYINKRIEQVTEDHSLVNELIKNGSITKEEAIDHPQKNVITKALGTSIDIEVDIQDIRYNSGDALIICSDGLSNMVDENSILDIVKSETDVNSACNRLVNLAKENGGLDNITLIIIKL